MRGPTSALVTNLAPDRQGEVPDFRQLFTEHFDYVWNALRRLGVREVDLEDVTHDVFLGIFRKLEQYDPERPLRPWIFGFAFRFASDYRDLARHRGEVPGDTEEHGDESPDALANVMQRQALEHALEVLDHVALERRAVFILHELDDCPMPEVALTLGIPVNTAYSRLRLARADLAAAARRFRSKGKP
jgi:RNA polymerase sigma-70 factor, ECF subfamily